MLPAPNEIATILKNRWKNGAARQHFIPLVAAHGHRVVDPDELAELLIDCYTKALPQFKETRMRFEPGDLLTCASDLCGINLRDYLQDVQICLSTRWVEFEQQQEVLQLENMFAQPDAEGRP